MAETTGPLTPDAEAALLSRVRRGDRGAFERIFHAYVLPLSRLAYQYVRSTDLADDIVQDAFITFYNEVAANPLTDRPFVYLQMLVRRRSIDELRRTTTERQWREDFTAAGETPAASAPAPEALARLEHEEVGAVIAAAMATLSPRVRAVATLRWYERLSRTEAADILGVSVRTVDAQLAKAASVVRAYLRAHGVVDGR